MQIVVDSLFYGIEDLRYWVQRILLDDRACRFPSGGVLRICMDMNLTRAYVVSRAHLSGYVCLDIVSFQARVFPSVNFPNFHTFVINIFHGPWIAPVALWGWWWWAAWRRGCRRFGANWLWQSSIHISDCLSCLKLRRIAFLEGLKSELATRSGLVEKFVFLVRFLRPSLCSTDALATGAACAAGPSVSINAFSCCCRFLWQPKRDLTGLDLHLMGPKYFVFHPKCYVNSRVQLSILSSRYTLWRSLTWNGGGTRVMQSSLSTVSRYVRRVITIGHDRGLARQNTQLAQLSFRYVIFPSIFVACLVGCVDHSSVLLRRRMVGFQYCCVDIYAFCDAGGPGMPSNTWWSALVCRSTNWPCWQLWYGRTNRLYSRCRHFCWCDRRYDQRCT